MEGHEIIAALRARLATARTLPEADRMCALAMRQARWLPEGSRPDFGRELGAVMGQLLSTRFIGETLALLDRSP
jgi:hypothetical protein